MVRRFRRSRTDVQVAGVCAGLADYLQMDVATVRVFTVILALFTSAPVLVAYILAAVFVPKADEAEMPPSLDVEWQADGMRVSWSGPIAPYAVHWRSWIGAIGAAVFLVNFMLCLGVFVSHGSVSGGSEAIDGFLQSVAGFTWTAAVLAAMAGKLPRPWALTLTHDALWVDRPLRRPERIDLAEVEKVEVSEAEVDLWMRSKETITLPAPSNPAELDPLLEELHRSRRRALEHREDLSAAELERARLDRLTSEAQSP